MISHNIEIIYLFNQIKTQILGLLGENVPQYFL